MSLNINDLPRSRQVNLFNPEFFICCIVLGLEYLHVNNILHRDIKPENLVLDDRGYVRITDFGIAKFYQKENSSETSGTPGYMSPEVMCWQNHTLVVDYFALGVMAYEFMMGVVGLVYIASVYWKE
jgi:serine/threonine protein kinase